LSSRDLLSRVDPYFSGFFQYGVDHKLNQYNAERGPRSVFKSDFGCRSKKQPNCSHFHNIPGDTFIIVPENEFQRFLTFIVTREIFDRELTHSESSLFKLSPIHPKPFERYEIYLRKNGCLSPAIPVYAYTPPPVSLVLSGDVEQNPGPQRRGKKRTRRSKQKKGPRNHKFMIVPPRMHKVLRYVGGNNMINVGSVNSNRRYVPTFAYDIDPLLGSTSMPGFSELGALYRQYRVATISWKAEFRNGENFNGTCYVMPCNFDPGANSANYISYLNNPRSTLVPIGPLTGVSIKTVKGSFSLRDFTGLPNRLLADDNTVGTIAGVSPVNNVWVAIGFVGDAVQVSGCMYSLIMKIGFDYLEPSTPPA